MNQQGKFSFMAMLFLIFGALAPGGAQEILMIHSYQECSLRENSFDKAFAETLTREYPQVKIHREYMDTHLSNREVFLESWYALMEAKYGGKPFDAIVAVDDPAFYYLRGRGGALWAGIPVFVAGITGIESHQLDDDQRFTGVTEQASLAETIGMIRQLDKKIHTLYVLSDTGTFESRRLMKEFSQWRGEHSGSFQEIRIWEDLGRAALEIRLPQLSPDSALLWLGRVKCDEGGYRSQGESASWLVPAASVPVYSPWDAPLPWGVVGGRLISSRQQGSLVAGQVIQYFQGTPFSEIHPPQGEALNPWVFNREALERWGYDEKDLPPGSLLYSRSQNSAGIRENPLVTAQGKKTPFSPWAGMVPAGVILLILLMNIALIIIFRRRCQRSLGAFQETLHQQKVRYENLVDNIPVALWEEDCSELIASLKKLIRQGVKDWKGYLTDHPEFIRKATDMIKVTYANQMTCQMMGVDAPEKLHGPLSRIADEANYPLITEEIIGIAEGQTYLADKMIGVEIPEKGKRDFLVSITLPQLNAPHEHLLMSLIDITEWQKAEGLLRKTLEEKTVLIQEIHHRVKNNLQIISSILRMQGAALGDPEQRQVLDNCQSRVRSMSLVHQLLYQKGDVSQLDMKEYLENLTREVASLSQPFLVDRGSQIDLSLHIDPLSFNLDRAIPCGLWVTEVMTNAYKHAFPHGRRGKVILRLEKEASGGAVLEVRDNGIGFSPQEFDESSGLGAHLIKALAEQMGGEYSFRTGSEGTSHIILFQ